jgi:hypothetical protein
MLRFGTLIALLMAFAFLTGVSFQAGATTPDTLLKTDQAGISDIGSSRVDSDKLDNSQVDGTARIRLAAAKLDPNATHKPSTLVCQYRQCVNHRVRSCAIIHPHGRRHCLCRQLPMRC